MSDQLLEQFARQTQAQLVSRARADTAPLEANICPTCHIAMDICNDDYVCQQCRRIFPSDRHFSTEVTKFGTRDSRYYSSSDPQREQRDGVFDGLVACRETYLRILAERRGITYVPNSSLIDGACAIGSFAPSTTTLLRCAEIYHDIQRKVCNSGETFTRRGDVKNEILAAILFFECIKREEMRSKREIAELMSLPNDGFSRGYEQLRRQAAKNNITLYSEDRLCAHMITYYFRTILGAYLDQQIATISSMDQPQQYITDAQQIVNDARTTFTKFVRQIIKCSNRCHIGINSQLQSRIVGTIWFIIRMVGYPITAQQIDSASGGIKKGTFLRFSRMILTDRRLLAVARQFFPQLSAPNFARLIHQL